LARTTKLTSRAPGAEQQSVGYVRGISGFPKDTGTALGVTAALAADGAEVPTALEAVTVNVYAVPLVRPVTVAVDPAVEAVRPPGAAVTVYPVIAEPPSLAGAVHETTA